MRRGDHYRFLPSHAPGRKATVKGLPPEVLIDTADEDLAADRWRVQRNSRHGTYVRRSDRAYLHRLIAERVLGRPLLREERPDHINGNGLDNRRSNLRIVTHRENCANRPNGYHGNRSGYRGVSYDKRRARWVASAKLNRKYFFIGYFETAAAAGEAARAWRIDNMPGYIPEAACA